MNKYIVIKKRKKELLNSIVKNDLKGSNSITKASYYISIILKWMVVLSSVLTLIISLVSGDYLKLIFIPFFIVTFYGLSWAISIIYKGLLSSAFNFRTEEVIIVSNESVIYSYHDLRSQIKSERFSYSIVAEKISEAKYFANTGELCLFGDIDEKVYIADEVSDSNVWAELQLLNCFECDIVEIMNKLGVEVNIIGD